MNTFRMNSFLFTSLAVAVFIFFLVLRIFVKTVKKGRRKFLAASISLFLMGSAVACGVITPEKESTSHVVETTSQAEADSAEETDSAEEADAAEEADLAELEIHFIDVGQGDATLITCDGSAMLIDAGENDKGTAVQLYLQKRNITKLDYVIGTHPDSDHIGGLDVILTKFDCETVILPDISKDTSTYRDVEDALYYKKYVRTLPNVGDTYSLGDASFTIIAPNRAYEETNNWSVGIRLVHGENSFLFTGDAEEAAETDMLQNGQTLLADVLKVPHHGSKTSMTEDFLKAVNPTYAVISCGADNSYGHPSASTMNALRSAGIQVFRTDEQGSIVAVSDGTDISFNCASSETYKAGEGTGSAEYILNLSTKKFHYAGCSAVDDMKEENKLPSNESRDEIILKGYTPCKRCNP